jgi:hypothetical protein
MKHIILNIAYLATAYELQKDWQLILLWYREGKRNQLQPSQNATSWGIKSPTAAFKKLTIRKYVSNYSSIGNQILLHFTTKIFPLQHAQIK